MAVTPDDIAVALGLPTPVEDPQLSQWQMWIDDARLLIQFRLGDLDALDQDILDYVVREAVVAQVRNPDTSTQVDVQVDDARVSKRYSTSYGRVTILDDWWDMLAPEAVTASGAFTISPAGEAETVCTDTQNWRVVPTWYSELVDG